MKLFTSMMLLIFCAFFVIPGTVLAQGPVAKIVVEGLSPDEIHELGWTTPPSTGLKVVGKGQLVYLSGHDAGGDSVIAYAWTLVSAPAGSNAMLDSTDTQWTTFIPDTTGQFVIGLNITTAGGTADTTVTITSANWVGVGTIGGATPNTGIGQCGLCHAGKVSEWETTGHSTMFSEAIDGLKSSHYNETCIECHTVGFDTLPTAVNNGFDDVASALNWVFPDTLIAGNWDSLLLNYPDLAQLANIQCENCHGPGSLHLGDKSKIDVTLDEGVCGRCHEEAPYHRKNTQWERSGHAIGVGFAAGRPDCAPCHSGYGFIHAVDPGNNLEQTTGFPQVTCQVCHDPHSDANEHQLRKVTDVTLNNGVVISGGGIGKFCMNCHKSRRDAQTYATSYHSHYGPHHSNQADMLYGTNAITFGLPYIPSSPHKYLEEACITCHMSATPAPGMPGRDFVGEHTFAMTWDGGTPDDPSDDVDNVAVCQNCHGPITSFEDIMAFEDYDGDGAIESAEAEVEGLLDSVGVLLPPLDSTAVVVTPAYNQIQLKAAYNYFFVEEDGSHGFHNFQYAVALLKLSKAALKYGVLSPGSIASIADIPNDQGKRVRITWTRFGGDGISATPVQFYGIWRRVDDPTTARSLKNAALYHSFESAAAALNTAKNPVLVKVGDDLWDFVRSVPAAGLDMYSAVVPTLYDSTAAGLHWSVFVVSGHTAIPTLYTVSAPDSGYSIDNLAPSAPGFIAGTVLDNGIEIYWPSSPDEDFNYFAVYRGTTPGFDPSGTDPIATTTDTSYLDQNVVPNTSYYYRVAAFDFSGNESDYSNELAVTYTDIGDNDSPGVPTRYVLEQNYPNPFNPTTAIRFGLPESQTVRLIVYDVLGKPIAKLISGKYSAGYHTVIWNGKDRNGNAVSTGIYIYRLETDSHVMTRKMMLMK